MKIGLVSIIFLSVILMLVSVSCTRFTGNAVEYSGSNIGNHIDGTYKLFDGQQIKTVNLEAGDVLNFSYNSTVEKGSLSMFFENPEKVTVVFFPVNTSGIAIYSADKSGNYRVVIIGENTQGKFTLSWKIE